MRDSWYSTPTYTQITSLENGFSDREKSAKPSNDRVKIYTVAIYAKKCVI